MNAPLRHGLKNFLAPELQTDGCFATGVTRQTLMKMCNFNVDFSKIFWGMGYGDPPQTTPHSPRPSGASRLARDLRSLHRRVPPLTKILATSLISTFDNRYYTAKISNFVHHHASRRSGRYSCSTFADVTRLPYTDARKPETDRTKTRYTRHRSTLRSTFTAIDSSSTTEDTTPCGKQR